VRQLPSGTVTLLFTDIEGSTRLLQELGRDRYVRALEQHRRLLRQAFTSHGGVEVEMQGDSFFFAFERATDAVNAAEAGQRALVEREWEGDPILVRIGIHTGEPVITDGLYAGLDVHRAARVMSAAHGGQVLISQTTRDLVDSITKLRDLGRHRLKDLSEPVALYQLGEGTFSPLKTLNFTNLPVQPSPLIGREQELAEVLALLRSSRLVTLTGPGGAGKTRLALQATAELVDEFADGVWWVPLAALREPELVEASIARGLGATEDLTDHLRTKRALLLLDNFEHLLRAAPRIAELLTHAPELRILVTSREHLAIAAEQEYAVPMMEVTEAVDLFTTRARQLQPDFQPDDAVTAICRRLDGLPLAIELAAARLNVLRPDQVLQRLGQSLDLLTTGGRDASERHQTLRATIEWSYDLLDNEEKRLFARLAVFAGGFGFDLAEAACGADIDSLGALVDGNLIRRTNDGRFFMLETIREYAAELLDQSPDAEELHRRHAHLMLTRVDYPGDLRQRRQWLAAIDREYADHRAALLWFQEHGERERLLQLASRLGPFWDGQEYFHEGRAWLGKALEASSSVTTDRASALATLGHIAWRQGALDLAIKSADAAAALAAELDDREVLAEAHSTRGAVHYDLGDLDRARTEYEKGLELFRSSGALDDVAIMTHDLGIFAFMEGDRAHARELFEESLSLCRERGYKGGEMNTLGSLGILELEEGRLSEAKGLFRTALQLALDLGRAGVGNAYDLVGLADVLVREGRPAPAAFLIAACDAYLEATGASIEPSIQPIRSRALDEISARLDPAEAANVWERGKSVPLKEAVEYALAHSLD
jgi:predicted ATPase/class 3 adenylate cyclase